MPSVRNRQRGDTVALHDTQYLPKRLVFAFDDDTLGISVAAGDTLSRWGRIACGSDHAAKSGTATLEKRMGTRRSLILAAGAVSALGVLSRAGCKVGAAAGRAGAWRWRMPRPRPHRRPARPGKARPETRPRGRLERRQPDRRAVRGRPDRRSDRALRPATGRESAARLDLSEAGSVRGRCDPALRRRPGRCADDRIAADALCRRRDRSAERGIRNLRARRPRAGGAGLEQHSGTDRPAAHRGTGCMWTGIFRHRSRSRLRGNWARTK